VRHEEIKVAVNICDCKTLKQAEKIFEKYGNSKQLSDPDLLAKTPNNNLMFCHQTVGNIR